MLAAVALGDILAPFFADWNDTHIFNPAWPAHARLHAALSVLLSAAFGALAVAVLIGRRRRGGLALPAALAAMPSACLLLSGLIPGAGFESPAAIFPGYRIAGMIAHLNVTLSALSLAAVAVAITLARTSREGR